MMITQTEEQYISPACEVLEIKSEGVIAFSGEGFENPDIPNTDI